MALNWADSSDDEDEAFLAPEKEPPTPAVHEEEEEEIEPSGDELEPPKEFVLPEHPPFTAFIGNLAFSIQDGNQLGSEIQNLVQKRFQTEIVVTASRIAQDRETNKPKGFGYVEVETIEQLKTVLQLNDGQSQIAGRKIHLDVAQSTHSQRRNNGGSGSFSGRSQSNNNFGGGGSNGDIDASKFMGGRFNRQNSKGGDNNNRGGDNNNRGGGDDNRSGSFRRQNSGEGARPTGQRPSLKLVPRGVSNASRSTSEGSSNSIFGGGKARDVGTWERGVPRKEGERRPSQRKEKDNNKDKGGRGGGDNNKGGRGGGDNNKGGRGGGDNNKGGRGGGDNNKGGRGGGDSKGGRGADRRRSSRQSSTGSRGGNNNKQGADKQGGEKQGGDKKEEVKPVEVPVPAAAPTSVPVVAAPAPAPKKVINKFAALDFGDSDDE